MPLPYYALELQRKGPASATHFMVVRFVLFFMQLGVWLTSMEASAQGMDGPEYELWLNPGVFSHHFDRSKNLREDNIGVGGELMLSADHVIMMGSFINSNRTRSRYAGYEWRPLAWQLSGFAIRGGVAVGVFDGYPNYHSGAWFPAALPMVSLESTRVGVNVVLIPTVANRLDGAVALQFKLRVW